MISRTSVNKRLARLTGYELRKARPAWSRRGVEPETDDGAASKPAPEPAPEPPLARAAAPSQQPDPATAADKPLEALPKDFDEELAATIHAVRAYTMTSPEKLHALISATRYVVRYGIAGDVVECGVWRGGSMHAVARTLDALGDHERDLYLYDTFDGMTAPTDKDVRWDGRSAASQLETQQKETSNVWAYASLEDVQAGFDEVPYPRERLHFVKGPVEETVPDVLPERIAILRLDTDWYESTAHELAHMYDRLVPGGVLMLDDYGWWQGSRTATDEFLERTGERLLLIRMGSGRVAVKP